MGLEFLQLWLSVRPSLRTGLLLSILLLIVATLEACATISKKEDLACQATEDHHGCIVSLLADKEYEREERELRRVEDYHALKAWCDIQPGMSMWYVSRGGTSVRFKKTGIPDRHTSYGCGNTAETMRTIQRGW